MYKADFERNNIYFSTNYVDLPDVLNIDMNTFMLILFHLVRNTSQHMQPSKKPPDLRGSSVVLTVSY